MLRTFEENEGGLLNFARSYKRMGIQVQENNDIVFKEWAPGAKSLSIVSSRRVDPVVRGLQRVAQGSISRPEGLLRRLDRDAQGRPEWGASDQARLTLQDPGGKAGWAKGSRTIDIVQVDKNSAWARYLIQNKDTLLYDCVYWRPENPY